MTNSVYHYFGAYLRITTNKVEVEAQVREFASGHRQPSGLFCSECGDRVEPKNRSEMKYPTSLTDDILSTEWEDELAQITPPALHGSGVIIAISNKGAGEWLTLDSCWPDAGSQEKQLPEPKEVHDLKLDFITRHHDIITELGKCDAVKFVDVRFGYVLNAEY